MLRFYAYKGCDGCRKARKWLLANDISFEEIPVREQPPSLDELQQAREALGLKALFNTSGMDYRKLGMKDKLPAMSEQEALQTLHECGNLVKRPFLVGETTALTGFKEAVWAEQLTSQ
ncbi:Spx/MgsR family RNA polymerase-binding regulatory protein [Verrucomicrobiaceae bacterium R5-34]|nr:Spx/MgsR family RNA polymerase-binding regulatory protein [Verrucomicrobiaceae bacterium R5-34]